MERFWSKVRFAGHNECWPWDSHSRGGYGQFWYEGRYVPAHRFSYEWAVGKVPDGLCLDHLCRNRACVNPRHLEAVTPGENVLRGEGPPARNARRTHCKHGHALPLSGDRRCVLCVRRIKREHWHRKHGGVQVERRWKERP